MQTNADFLAKGKPFPPENEQARLAIYDENEALFLTKHAEVWGPQFDTIARRSRKKLNGIDTVTNYHQLLAKKTADFICGEPPTIETKNKDTDALVAVLDKQGFFATLYESMIDISRFGNAVLKLRGTRLTATPPRNWYPIVAETDLKEITAHAIAFPTAADANGEPQEVYSEIHTPGLIEIRRFKYSAKDKELGAPLEPAKKIPTGLPDFAVRILTNTTHSGSVYGLDDYAIINSLVRALIWRLFCIQTVLDKHSEPSVSGPASALDYDERTGLYFLNLGSYFRRDSKEDPDVQYITWDGNLEAAYKEVEVLQNQINTLTEMGQAFSEAAGGTADSGEALKLRMVSPRIKAARIAGMNAGRIKDLIALFAKANGLDITRDDLAIKWNDGLPSDDKEQIEMLAAATLKPIMSQRTALKRQGLSDADADDELAQIQAEEEAAAPVYLRSVDPNAEKPTETDEAEEEPGE